MTMRRFLATLAVGAMVLGSGVAVTAVDVVQPRAADAGGLIPHTVAFDQYSLMVDGKRLYLWSGEFHYWRLPSPDLWRDVLQKMKASGFNATSIYFDWGYHSPAPGVYDFTGVRDVDRLLDIAAEVGIYVIARPGPYINAETDSGGFPGWLTTQQGRARSTCPARTPTRRVSTAPTRPTGLVSAGCHGSATGRRSSRRSSRVGHSTH